MGTHLLYLEPTTHLNFQFGPEGFKCLLPSMVQALPSSSNKFFESFAHHEIFFVNLATSMLQMHLILFVDKIHQTIATSLWLHQKNCI
jgi:hypothetical protein